MTITQSSTRLVAVAAGVAVALVLMLGASMPVRAAALSQTQIQSILNLLTSFGADAATISNVQAALNGQATTGTTGTTGAVTGGVCPFTWSRSLTVGSTGADVMALQKFLNMDASTMVAASGAGSAGMETSYFGPATKRAVAKLQVKYGITPAAGYFGPLTRAKVNSLCTGASTGGTTTGGTTTGGTTTGGTTASATISAAAQPANSVAPQGASRVPFTTFTVTAGSQPVTLNSVTVMRQGPSLDTDFSGVELIDNSTGAQLGTSRVLDANHSATIGSSVVIPAGTSKTFTVAANIAAVNGSIPGSGDVASFAVTAVNTGSTVGGALPIVGASNTINTALTIGSASITTSSFDPNTAASQPIGTTAYRFTGFRIQAGSTEDETLKSITWYQSGSASGIQNVQTVVNGTSYPTTVDSTGRYYTTVFPTGIVIPKGQSLDVYVQGDLGANTTANTYAEFDIYRSTDIYLVGNTYGFGITPTTSGGTYQSGSTHTTQLIGGTNTPWIQGSTVTVTAGTFSTIQNASSVGAQNVAVNVPNQPLGGFQTNLTGEGVQVQSLTVHFQTSATTTALQNVSLVNENGQVVAGPYNAVADTSFSQHVTFSGSIDFPTGTHTYTLEGQVPSGTNNGTTITASTSPATDWSNVTGDTTGNSVSLSGQTMFTMSPMTVQAASMVVANGTSPTSQNIVSGGQNIQMATVQIDASQSGEDLRLSSVPMTLTTSGNGVPAHLSNCLLSNGSTVLNTGTYVVNSANITGTASPYSATFSFNNSLTIPKGTVMNLSLTCNLSSSAAAGETYAWAPATSLTATGATSGSSVTIGSVGGTAPTMTVATAASLAVSQDSSAPAYMIAAGGSTGVTVNVLKLRPSNEPVNLQKVALTLASGASTNDVTQAYIYAGNNVMTTAGGTVTQGTLLGTLTFIGGSATATSTLTQTVQLPVNTDATLVVKADLAKIGTSQPGTEGDVVKINNSDAQGVGANSGTQVNGTGTATASGVAMYATYPTVAAGPAVSASPNGGNQVIKKFSVTANSSNGLGLYKVSFNIATSSVTLSNLTLYAYTDSNYSIPANTGNSGGVFGGQITAPNTGTNAFTENTTPLQIGSGQTMYFSLVANAAVASGANNWSVTATLLGDSSAQTGMAQASAVNTNFVWSPNATSTAATTTNDWTNSYGVPGLPSTGL